MSSSDAPATSPSLARTRTQALRSSAVPAQRLLPLVSMTAPGSSSASSSPASLVRLRELRPTDPRESLPYELRGLVNQLLGRHLRGEAVQGTLVGGPLHGDRFGGVGDQLIRLVAGGVHRYTRLTVPSARRRRGPLTLFTYAGPGAQQVMDLG